MVPGLFGIKKSNRNFNDKDNWGKNQFNSSFPASLCCYLHSKGKEAVFLSIKNGSFDNENTISIKEIFRIDPFNEDTYFAFETTHSPYQKFFVGSLPRTDLVVQKESTGECLSALEIKLTALPDNTTCEETDEKYGSEIVVRPDTIFYLACSIAQTLNEWEIIADLDICDWTDPKQVLKKVDSIVNSVKRISFSIESAQKVCLLQPIWKTTGKSPKLDDNCLDVFAWSNAAFCYFISDQANNNPSATSITRQTRTAIWLYKMLLDIKKYSKFDGNKIIDGLSFNTKNDKAFACSGTKTNKYMRCERLVNPLITKKEIKNIILGGGQNLLSPERRFDAIIFNSPELFDD